MRAAILCISLLISTPIPARADAAEEWETAQATVNELVDTCLKIDRQTACIGRAASTCFVTELAPLMPHSFWESLAPKPIFQMQDWCKKAEEAAWQSRLDADVKEIRQLLRDRPALREFDDQQRAWEAFVAKPFFFDRVDPDEPWIIRPRIGVGALVAIRSLQVQDMLLQVRDCMTGVWASDSSVCEYLNKTP